MSSKLILLMGGLLSSLIVYFCLNSQYKNPVIKNIYAKKEKIQQKTITPIVQKQETAKKKEEKKEVVITKLLPFIYYIPNKQISLLLSKNENNESKIFFQNLCKNQECIQDINFTKNVLKAKWTDIAIDTISYFKENNISKAIISSSDEKIEINATFNNEKKYNEFINSILSVFDKNIIINNSILQEKKNIPDTNQSDNNITTQEEAKNIVDTSKIQNDINKIINKYPIYFKNGSSILTKSGKKILWKIIKILRKNPNIKYTILVTGHTNAVGDERFNKILSQKRADTVRWYLKQRVKNIASISAAGFGSSRPKIKKYPRNKKNRRVEIIIKKGVAND